MLAAGNRICGRWCLPALASAGGSGEVRAGNRDLSQPCTQLFLGDVSPQQWAWRKLGVSPEAPPKWSRARAQEQEPAGERCSAAGGTLLLAPVPVPASGLPSLPSPGVSTQFGSTLPFLIPPASVPSHPPYPAICLRAPSPAHIYGQALKPRLSARVSVSRRPLIDLFYLPLAKALWPQPLGIAWDIPRPPALPLPTLVPPHHP